MGQEEHIDWNKNNADEAENVAKTIDKWVNNFSFQIEPFVDYVTHYMHRTLQQSFGNVVFALIKRWSELYQKGVYDARNESTLLKCREIDQLMSKQDDMWAGKSPMV